MALSITSKSVTRALLTQVRCMSGIPLTEIDQALTPMIENREPSSVDVQVTTLDNGVTVASDDGHTPFSKVSVFVKAGSAMECKNSLGFANVLKHMAFKQNADTTAFKIQRETESSGTKLSASNDTETIQYSATFLRDGADDAVSMLGSAVTKQSFNQWDIDATAKAISAYNPAADSKAAMMDLVRQGAFHAGAGNATVCPAYRVGGITSDALSAFAADNFTGGNITVVGSGIDHATLVALANESFGGVNAGDTAGSTAKYYGGFESRVGSSTGAAQVAIAFEGASRGADVPATLVLEKLLFSTGRSSVKYGAGSGAVKAVAAAVQADASVETESFSMSTDGAGIVGVYLTCAGGAATAAVTGTVAAAKAVLGGGFTDVDVARAKNQVKAQYLDLDAAGRVDFYGSQLLGTKQPLTPTAFAAVIDGVSHADVVAAANKANKSKAVVVSSGNIDNVPFASDLGL